ncbi:hypothetical protein LLG07_08205 [bacterium]|nr:hypothetical protein [bacterium]
MTSIEIVGIIAIILISTFSLIGIIISIPLFKVLTRLRKITEKINNLTGELDVTVKKLNEEIGDIGQLTKSAGSIVEQLEKIIKLARILISSPIIKIISTTAGFMNAMSKDSKKNNNSNKEGV